MKNKLKGIYAITAELESATMLAKSAAILQAGASVLQYRDKQHNDAHKLANAHQLKALCRQYGALFIVNDDIQLAAEVGADGVHLGKDDANLQVARQLLGADKIIGVSCYADFARAQQAAQQGADYLAFGAMFASPSKIHAERIGSFEPIIKARELGLPICLIGGINLQNAQQLLTLGADMWALISALYTSADCQAATRQFMTIFKSRGQYE